MATIDPQLAAEAHKFLSANPMAILSTASPDGEVWGSAIYYYVDDEFNFYFVTRTGTQKSQYIELNPKAALTIADEPSQTTVQLSGKVVKVSAEDYENIVFEKLAAARPTQNGHNRVPPLEKIHDGNYVAYKLIPSTMQYANYSVQLEDSRATYAQQVI